jgi:hypothetical protein
MVVKICREGKFHYLTPRKPRHSIITYIARDHSQSDELKPCMCFSYSVAICVDWLHLYVLHLNIAPIHHVSKLTYTWFLLGISECEGSSGRVVFFLKVCLYCHITSGVEVTFLLIVSSRISLFICLTLRISFKPISVLNGQGKRQGVQSSRKLGGSAERI